MIRYLSPDSSECSRRMCVAHSTYSGIDRSSNPRNAATRFCAATSTTIPRIDVSSSAKYSPSPASTTARDRHDSSTVPRPPTQNTIVSASVRSSIASESSMIEALAPHCQTPSPIVTPSVTRVRNGTTCRRTNADRSSPTISTTQAPAVKAISGESASQSMVGPLGVTAPPP
jgi:hypothetical protein